MEQIIDGAFGLGIAGFMLLIVLIVILFFVGKMASVFTKIPEKFDVLSNKIAESNKELSNQLIKTLVVQENILSVMKDTISSVNNNTTKMAIVEDKIESTQKMIKDISNISENTIRKIDEVNEKVTKIISNK